MSAFNKIIVAIMIVGAINWGLWGLFTFDLVGWLLGGSASLASRIVFVVVGLAGLAGIALLFAPPPRKGEAAEP